MHDICENALGRRIGRGQSSEVYAYGEAQVVKLYRLDTDPARITREFAISTAVHAAGAPSWRVDELISVGDRTGILGERISGRSLHDLFRASEITLPQTLKILVALNVTVCRLQRVGPPEFPLRPKTKFMSKRPAYRRSARRYGVCHGDIHLKNVFIDETGAPRLIDWGSAYYGPVISDVLRTNELLRRSIDAERSGLPAPVKRLAALTHRFWASRKLGLPLFNLGWLAKFSPQPWVMDTAIVLA